MQASRQISHKAAHCVARGEVGDPGRGDRRGEAVQLCVSIFIIFIKNVIMQHVDVCTARRGWRRCLGEKGVWMRRGEEGAYVK